MERTIGVICLMPGSKSIGGTCPPLHDSLYLTHDVNREPSKDFTLIYVEVIQRHHKRTPYASNTFFEEDIPWPCDGSGPTYGGTS